VNEVALHHGPCRQGVVVRPQNGPSAAARQDCFTEHPHQFRLCPAVDHGVCHSELPAGRDLRCVRRQIERQIVILVEEVRTYLAPRAVPIE